MTVVRPSQVPYDKPLVSHDMLLRFIGVDLLGAAGPAAQVPSRVGDEQEAVLGETHPNGTAVNQAGSASDSIDVVDGTLDSTTGTTGGDTKAIGGGSDTVEALVNAGSALVIVVLMVLAFGVFWVVRKRSRRRKGSVSGSGLGHARRISVPIRGGDESEGPHELDELVGSGGRAYEDEEDDEERFGKSLRGEGKGKGRLRDEEEIFGLGGEDDSDDGEDLGGRKKRNE